MALSQSGPVKGGEVSRMVSKPRPADSIARYLETVSVSKHWGKRGAIGDREAGAW